MSEATLTHADHGGHDHGHDHHHDHHGNFWTQYVFSTDHKVIAKQFLITGIIMAIFGIGLSLLFRLQLAFPDSNFAILETLLGKWAPDGKLDPNFYLALVTMHGTFMVFFVLTAGLSGTFSNFLIPLQIGARDMASGFMNMLSYWFFAGSSVLMVISLFVESGPASGGWTIYPPLSALPTAMPGSGLGMTLWLVAMVLFIASSLLGGINYITTVLNLRTQGMSFDRLPLTIWAFFLTAIIGVLSFPVLFAAALLLVFDRSLGTSFYLSDIFIDGQLQHFAGGSPILFQHLFWFLGHPEVYIVLLPALGISSEVISVNSRKPIFGYKAMIASMVGIAFLSFIVWAHHMFVSGMNPFLGTVFMLFTLVIAVPSAIKAFNYITTLWRGNIKFTTAMLFAIGLVSFFISGGITGIFLGNAALDIPLHDTYFVTAHFHLVMGSASAFGFFAGIYHWFPKMFGRMMNKRLGYIHFWFTFISLYLVFFPMHFMGMGGVARHYYSQSAFAFMSGFQDIQVFITIAAFIGAAGQVIFLFNFFGSIFFGKKSELNPWESNTLEWTTPVNPGHGNWPGAIPSVYRWPYDYSKPGIKEDFLPQHIPDEEVEYEEGHPSTAPEVTPIEREEKEPKTDEN
ncbi:cbb3-type cytochrome c oxidase subunit I [Pontibacter sp. G13]|uniref:cytochrome c oxidase subunit I n=1 Tax=Pontibacter sp. G13 TaxID=3074898 RepID=UPI00288C1CA3|nr:cbb3-type cytochrome c oxidase subunit I [Pontibacter sp. G13]WNJ16605.1 cbb3-type cytochrome c oxidase subunit I [Pontibacter sp. G13]